MEHYDVVVVGSGMAGSCCATVLSKLGYKIALLERGSHPRFAIGESATPVMSKKIRFLGELYGIPEFVNISTYDRIEKTSTDIVCGPKELFHYYVHKVGQKKVSNCGVIPEVIVQTPEIDVQYLRASTDEYLVKVAENYGVTYLDNITVNHVDFHDEKAYISCVLSGEERNICSDFVIDGTGFNSIIGQKYKMKITGNDLNTPLKSRSIFSHFENVGDFEEILKEDPIFVDKSPAPRCRATQHHCFEGGWLWLIPFDNGVTSVGINLDIDVFPENSIGAEEEFWSIISKFPIIERLLSKATTKMPMIKTGRLQFLSNQMVGDRWAMLPASAYGLDAWFSTGLAVSFMAIHRLVEVLDKKILPNKDFKREHLIDYEACLKKEYYHVSKMVNGIYKSFKHFDIFKSYCLLCFMGSENYLEKGGIKHAIDHDHLLLSAGDSKFVNKFNQIYEKVIELSKRDSIDIFTKNQFSKFIREDMREFNFREFGNEALGGMHKRRVMVNS